MSLPLADLPDRPSDRPVSVGSNGGSAPPVNPNEDKKIAYGIIALALVVVVVLVWRFIKRKSKKKEDDKEE